MGLWDRMQSELAYLGGAVRALRRVTSIAKAKTRTLPDVMDELAETYGDRVALISERETFTFKTYNERANQYARWAQINSIEKGDVIALMMPNRPEYLACWLGIIRMGGVVALLNTNLKDRSLSHCINIVSPKHIIVDDALADQFMTCEAGLNPGAMIWFHGGDQPNRLRIDTDLDLLPKKNIPRRERPSLTINDKCLYIYTSGTTGLPKAANINHYRIQSIMSGFSAATAATDKDRMYICLPLYHTSGGILAVGTTLTVGGSVVIAEKFSASRFWDDVVDQNCTMFQYIGELCRYLLNSPPHAKETRHMLRIISGNGLRPDIWDDFLARFKIPKLLEWYAATEGNAVLFNFDGQSGSIGRVPKWLQHRFPIKPVRFDYDAQAPLRGEDGFCRVADPDEVGELISQILDDPSKPSQRFEGYSNDSETGSKILTDVFEKGDRWFRTGDLVRQDRLGYFYFVDRIGDTFRWKGENVATSEVSEVMAVLPGVQEANIYGVAVPGQDGKAGMAALVVDDNVSLDALKQSVEANLPAYARPLFLRILDKMDLTGTFKVRKVDLAKEGFDPSGIGDRLFFAHPGTGRYEPLDEALYADIISGTVRL